MLQITANRLKTVSHQTVGEEGLPSGSAYLLDTRQYDGAGRLVQSGPAGGLDAGFVTALTGEELNASGLVTKKSFYDDNGRLVQQKVLKADGSRSYDVYYDSLDAEGNALQYRVVDENDTTQTYTKTYEKRESYLETSIHGVRSDNEGRPSDSTSSYDVNGHLTKVSETDWPEDDAEAQNPGPNLERQFETDANGIVLRKTQEGNILKQLIVSGQVMTAYGKGTDPAKQLNDEGKPNYIAQGEFGATYEGIDNRYNSGASSYTVQSGDTLAGIARSVWGDASLWWKLADVNGLSGQAAQGPDSRLTEGQSLSIPGQVSGQHNTAQTHKPYDPTEVVGDTTPNMPAPPADEGGGCGILGKIIMIVVAVAVTAVTGGAGGAVSSFWGGLLGQGSAAAAVATGATAAAAGSVASQAVGVAIGAQSKFSWKNVALAAVSGGVSGGLGTVDFTGSGELGSLGNTVIRSALGNTISQGIGVATGLQKSFDWKSVAGAAVGAGVGWGVGQALGSDANTLAGASLRSFAAGAATALVRGGKISIAQVAVDAFGQAMGDGLGDTLRVGQSQENSPAFMGGGAGGGGGSGGNGHYEPDNGPDWGTGAVAGDTGRWTAEPAGQPALTGGDFARMDRASEEVWAAQGGAWEQPSTAATDRAFLEAFQNPGALAPTGEGVLMAAGPGYSGMGSGSQRDANIAHMLNLSNEPEAMGFEAPLGAGSVGVVDMAPTKANAVRLGLLGPDGQTDGAWSASVTESNVVGVPLPPFDSDASSPSWRVGDQVFYNNLIADADNPFTAVAGTFGRAFNNAGHDLIDLATGAYSLATDGNARANAAASLSNVLNRYGANPLDWAVSGMQAGYTYGQSTSLSETAEDLVRYGAGGLASGGVFRAAGAIGEAALSGELMGPAAGSRQAQLGAINLASPRYQPGVASFGDDLVPASGRWLDASVPTPIPLQVAKQLEGQSFKTFSDLQSAVWRTIGSDAELSANFGQQAIGQMSVGNAPFAPTALQNAQFGGRFNLHHVDQIVNGGAVYDLSNLRIVSPVVHTKIHYPGAPK
ncbi:LysM peptidoglycan-binding domain-containing protein [Acidovorax facilis]|uniref:LysM peptidoglycan-binding domain-containing protein n=1 Tax=Acidovorax facilis TaxID=12917 RepID=UPI003CF89BFC